MERHQVAQGRRVCLKPRVCDPSLVQWGSGPSKDKDFGPHHRPARSLDRSEADGNRRAQSAPVAAYECGPTTVHLHPRGHRDESHECRRYSLSPCRSEVDGSIQCTMDGELLDSPIRSGRDTTLARAGQTVRLFPFAGRCSGKDRSSKASSSQQSWSEKIGPRKGEGDDKAGEMGLQQDALRTLLPETHQGPPQEEVQEEQFKRISSLLREQLFRPYGRQCGEAHVTSPPRIFDPDRSQGGIESPSPTNGGRRGGELQHIQPVCATSGGCKGRKQTPLERNVNLGSCPRSVDFRQHSCRDRLLSPENEVLRVDTIRDTIRTGSTAGTPSQRGTGAEFTKRGQDGQGQLSSRNEAAATFEGSRKAERLSCLEQGGESRRKIFSLQGERKGAQSSREQGGRAESELKGSGERFSVSSDEEENSFEVEEVFCCEEDNSASGRMGLESPPGNWVEGSSSADPYLKVEPIARDAMSTLPVNSGTCCCGKGNGCSVSAGMIGKEDSRLVPGAYELLELGPIFRRLFPSVLGKTKKAVQNFSTEDDFPLPLPQESWFPGCEVCSSWAEGMVRGLNWLSCGSFELGKTPPTIRQGIVLAEIRKSCEGLGLWVGVEMPTTSLSERFHQKWINSYGEEVHVAQSLRWENISESLPKAGLAGIVPAAQICLGGFKEFLEHPHMWLKPPEQQVWMKPPRVMIPEDGWSEVVEGLLHRGICGIMPLSQAFSVLGQPILGGLFGVPKQERTSSGHEILRLIMDLRPINQNFLSLGGDLSTLPVLSQMFQLELHVHESIIISSEDIRAMFYIVGLPEVWKPYLGFSRVIPRRFCPADSTEDYILYSKVLPMGFVNSVAVAQHLHRRIVAEALQGSVSSAQEIRRDKEFPTTKQYFRIYLDNFDELCIRSKDILNSGQPSLTALLTEKYLELDVPRNEKKAVFQSESAEVQGAWIDGTRGWCIAKPSKTAKYLAGVWELLQKRKVTQKQLQMVIGGIVYIFSFRRPLMSVLNEVWHFISSFQNEHQLQAIPQSVREELMASLCLSPFAKMDFRQESDYVVTASDASESGGGLCASTGLTNKGVRASEAWVRGEVEEPFTTGGFLVVSLFDGVGSLRVAMDALGIPVLGYIAVEKSPSSRRVVECNFPSCVFYEDVQDITKEKVQHWAANHPTVSAVLLGGGPPCQGVAGLEDFCRVKTWVVEVFAWCPVFFLMESVSSMTREDRSTYTNSVGVLPYEIDSKYLSPCRRPRLWWFNWTVPEKEGICIYPPQTNEPSDFGAIEFHASYEIQDFLRPGWRPACSAQDHRFSTFTAAQPCSKPRRKPAGLQQCSDIDLAHWKQDRHRFPPFVYRYNNGVLHRKKGWRTLCVEEKELMMGFPLNYTEQCSAKNFRANHPVEHDDLRMTLVGNAWHVGVVSLLLQPLAEKLGILPSRTCKEVMQRLQPGSSGDLQGLLFRDSFQTNLPFQTIQQDEAAQRRLIQKLTHLVSPKGTDVMLKSGTEPLPQSHRLRNSLSPGLWQWKTICGWKWRPHQGQAPEHINKLELRAIHTSLKWRLFRRKTTGGRFLHLVDSMVSLQLLNKGRTSSRKLRRVSKKIASLLLGGNLLLVLAYTNTKTNPADRPSRRSHKRKWGDVR